MWQAAVRKTPQDDQRFCKLSLFFFTVPYFFFFWTKKRTTFLPILFISCTNRNTPQFCVFLLILRIHFICVLLPHRLRWGGCINLGCKLWAILLYFFFFFLRGKWGVYFEAIYINLYSSISSALVVDASIKF